MWDFTTQEKEEHDDFFLCYLQSLFLSVDALTYTHTLSSSAFILGVGPSHVMLCSPEASRLGSRAREDRHDGG